MNNNSFNTWLLITNFLAIGAIYYFLFLRSTQKKSKIVGIQFTEDQLNMLEQMRQRCEEKSILELCGKALATHDVLTSTIQEGGKIKIEWPDGTSESFDPFHIEGL